MLLQNLLMSQAQARPGSAAMVCGRESISYGELDALTNRIARSLREAGCERGDRVGILLPKSIPAIAAMLGSLKAGCIYVPLDTASPAARLAKIVDACEPKCVLACDASAGLLDGIFPDPAKSAGIGWFGEDEPPEGSGALFRWSDVLGAPAAPLPCGATPEDAAHILFTSGSTGVPKGVVITHANIMAFLEWAASYFRPSPPDRISCHPPLHFDLSMFDIYGTFMAGAELHLVPPEISLLPHKLADFIRRSRLTQWFSVPSALKYMAQFDVVRADDFPDLERLLWCGEALPTPVLNYFMDRLPHVAFTNLYGPTETTIASSFYTVPSRPKDDKVEIPIGVACDGESLLVLDDERRPVAPGEIGVLYIQGSGLSPGILAGSGEDPRGLRGRRRAGPDVQHRRPRQRGRRRVDLPAGQGRFANQEPGLPDRTRGDRGGALLAGRVARMRRRGGPLGRLRRPHHLLRLCPAGGREAGSRGFAGQARRASAILHVAIAMERVRRASAERQRESRPSPGQGTFQGRRCAGGRSNWRCLLQLLPTLTDSLVDEVHALVRQFSPHVESAQTDLIEAGILDSASLVRLLLTVEARFAVAIPMEEVDIDSFRTVAAIADLVRERKAAPANAELRGAPGRTVLPQPRGAAPGPVPERDGSARRDP